MRILFFSHYFPPEGNAPASRTYEHCVRWVRAGHDVTVITCVPNVPNGVPYEGYRNRLRSQSEVMDGIKVIRVWTLLAANAGFAMRILNYVSFMITAFLRGWRVKRPDVVIATSPQFFCGWAGVLTRWFRRVPFILEVRDIWPESITAVGAMKKGLVIRVLEFFERRMYLAADHIVTVGNGYREQIISKVAVAHRITTIYNGVDGEQFSPQTPSAQLRSEWGMADKLICSYVGTIGMAHNLEVVIEAAKYLKAQSRSDIGFVLVGDGAQRIHLEELNTQAETTDLVRFTGRVPKSDVPDILASSNCLLVHLKACSLFHTVIPSKIFEAMAMNQPVIMGVPGEACEIVLQANAGIAFPPGNASQLAESLIQLRENPSRLQELQQNGRQFVLQKFSRDRFANDYLDVMHSISAN